MHGSLRRSNGNASLLSPRWDCDRIEQARTQPSNRPSDLPTAYPDAQETPLNVHTEAKQTLPPSPPPLPHAVPSRRSKGEPTKSWHKKTKQSRQKKKGKLTERSMAAPAPADRLIPTIRSAFIFCFLPHFFFVLPCRSRSPSLAGRPRPPLQPSRCGTRSRPP